MSLRTAGKGVGLSSTLIAMHTVSLECRGGNRERKKAKVGELQGMVTALSDKLQELTTARNLNAQLRKRNRALAQVRAPPLPSFLSCS